MLTIPCPDPTAEEHARDSHQNAGLKLARQEDWDTLAQQLQALDAKCAKTDGGMPIAELMAFGARADVVAAAEHALVTGRPAHDAPIMDGIEALEQVLDEHPDDPMIAAIVAHAHIDIGWAWRGTGWDIEVPMPNREAFDAHFERAGNILAPFIRAGSNSALIASAKCAVNAGAGVPLSRVVADYESWITQDPRNPKAMRAFGGHLLPRWHGTYERLDLEARRMAGLTHDVWGAGAYAWVMMDAISTDTEACARLDLDFFLDGLRDILRCTRDQHIVNLLAAYCANTMGATPTGHDEADYMRTQIAEAAAWIVRDHLTELHPMLWAHATRGFDNAMRIRCRDRFASAGYADALRVLSDLFRREIAAGQRIVFTKNGPVTHGA
ncbi:hypothetical protein [uncultured Tateyamaria sp.]|uniref:hypothetical protein n=1 Tax=Tateyamaria sp. 1078 TaxID=3417464 RepID=UPI00261C7915|nr:hypothetical protein [uncultured Tateyamaria sp.]